MIPTNVTNAGGNSPTAPPNDVSKLIDGNVATKFLDFNKQPVGFQFSSQVASVSYAWWTGDDFEERDMLSWSLQGRKTATGSWTTLHTVSNHPVTNSRNQIVGPFDLTVGNEDCIPCPPGTYAASAASTTCTNCAAGTYSTIAGSTACTA
jgi:hypothetical protein